MVCYRHGTHHFAQRNSCDEEAVEKQPWTNCYQDPEEEVRIRAWFWICNREQSRISLRCFLNSRAVLPPHRWEKEKVQASRPWCPPLIGIAGPQVSQTVGATLPGVSDQRPRPNFMLGITPVWVPQPAGRKHTFSSSFYFINRMPFASPPILSRTHAVGQRTLKENSHNPKHERPEIKEQNCLHTEKRQQCKRRRQCCSPMT